MSLRLKFMKISKYHIYSQFFNNLNILNPHIDIIIFYNKKCNTNVISYHNLLQSY